MNKRSKKGFTLMEMLIVVAIIVILVVIAIPTFSAALGRAGDAANEANVRAARAVAAVAILSKDSDITSATVEDDWYFNAAKGVFQADGTTIDAYGKKGTTAGTADQTGNIIKIDLDASNNIDLNWVTKPTT